MTRSLSPFPVGPRAVVLAILLSPLLSPSLTLAAPARGEQTQLELLRAMPQDLLATLTPGGKPDAQGMVSHNRQRWFGAEYQRGAALYLIAAASRGDRAAAERAWSAVEATFAHQQKDGSFGPFGQSGKPLAMKDVTSDNAFWLADFCQAVLVLRRSPLAEAFEERVHRLEPQIQSAAALLARGTEALTARDARTTNRYFIDALACALSGLLLHDEPLEAAGKRFADLGLRHQRPEGFFEEDGGSDSGYNAVSIWQLQIFSLYFPDPRYDAALARAVKWELGRIGPDGTISVEGNRRTGLGQELYFGKKKEINYPEAVLSLLYYGEQHRDEAAVKAALRAYRHYQTAR